MCKDWLLSDHYYTQINLIEICLWFEIQGFDFSKKILFEFYVLKKYFHQYKVLIDFIQLSQNFQLIN